MEQYYSIVKDIHSYLRWIILALAIITVLKYLVGWLGKKKFVSIDDRLSLFFVSSLDLQLLLGLVLYFFLSPVTQSGSQFDPATVRFYTMEHPMIMLLAIILAHVGRVLVKKSASDNIRFKRGTIFFGLSLLLILSRMPW
ncbi:MAG TPA: hypothetical protein VFE57_07465 [Cyclobacteriaceae bacterium]|nr:hypothetical protein [Cyclobacteriaceae bacterium]